MLVPRSAALFLSALFVTGFAAAAPAYADPPRVATTVVHPESFGAVGNGRADDTRALQQALDSAGPDVAVWLTPGKRYAHAGLLFVRRPGETVTGGGTLLATDESESSVWLQADDVTLDGVTVAIARTTRRWSTWDQMGVRVDGHSGVRLHDVQVRGAAAAGVYVGGGATGFVLDHVSVSNTRADGIHLTEGVHDGQVIAPTVRNSGDDGVAVISYAQDGGACHDITVSSPRVFGTSWGRGLSVVGGNNITVTNVDLRNTNAAGIYLGDEGNPWFTAPATNVSITGGVIIGANTNAAIDHGAVLVVTGQTGVLDRHLAVAGLRIRDTRASASRDLGVITYGLAPQDVLFSDLTIVNGPTSAYSGNTPQASYRLRNIVQNGVRLPDAG